MKTENLYISALEFAEEKLNNKEGFSANEIWRHLESKGLLDLSDDSHCDAAAFLVSEISTGGGINPRSGNDTRKNYKNFMSIESYFKLIEYKELKEARMTAKTARNYSIAAIFFAGFSVAWSVIQSWSPVKIDEKLLSQFETSISNDNKVIEKLIKIDDSLQVVNGSLTKSATKKQPTKKKP